MPREEGAVQVGTVDHHVGIEVRLESELLDLTGVNVEHRAGLHFDWFEVDVMDAVPAGANDQLMKVCSLATAQFGRAGASTHLGATEHFDREEWMLARLESDIQRAVVRPASSCLLHANTLRLGCVVGARLSTFDSWAGATEPPTEGFSGAAATGSVEIRPGLVELGPRFLRWWAAQ